VGGGNCRHAATTARSARQTRLRTMVTLSRAVRLFFRRNGHG
jgi:hypothetical protein